MTRIETLGLLYQEVDPNALPPEPPVWARRSGRATPGLWVVAGGDGADDSRALYRTRRVQR